MVIFPVIGTKKPAPDENLISLTVILKPSGLPRLFESSESEYCVNCGKQTPIQFNFCVECGFRF